jgi:hypothetical protein
VVAFSFVTFSYTPEPSGYQLLCEDCVLFCR